jgi:hypothetical protein
MKDGNLLVPTEILTDTGQNTLCLCLHLELIGNLFMCVCLCKKNVCLNFFRTLNTNRYGYTETNCYMYVQCVLSFKCSLYQPFRKELYIDNMQEAVSQIKLSFDLRFWERWI